VSKKQNKFQILKSLEQYSHPTQRQLSNELGVSLGRVNYCLKSLIEKGFIKVNNFRNSNNKTQWNSGMFMFQAHTFIDELTTKDLTELQETNG
jgi:predicted transcriptional regulator